MEASRRRAGDLAAVLLATRPSGSAAAALGEALATLCALGAQAWPGVELADETFVRHLGERLPSGEDPGAALGRLHAADLYLACACLRGAGAGRESAVRALEEQFFAAVPKSVARFDPSPAFGAEVQQALRERLLMGPDGRPRLLDYNGSGSLAAWIRVAAVRTALNLVVARKRADAHDARAADEVDEVAAATPELRFIQLRYREPIALSLREAFAALGEKERSLLRWAHVEGLDLSTIGALYGVHKSTVSRWLARACEELLDDTRRRAAARLRLSRSALDSLLRAVRDQLEVSLSLLAK
jgi:RNA polymerase sigma-70 factor (ECF subfamily)